MKRKNTVISLLLSACLALSGCGTSAAQTTTAPEQETVAQETEASQTETNETAQTENESISSEQEEVETEVAEQMQTTTYTLNGVDFTMIYVEAGTFTMGSDNTNVAFSESPAHTVTISQDYLMGETEVTEALWNAVMGSGGGSNTMPKTSVTWNDAHDFIDRLNEIAHEQGLIAENENFKLPTEAEWEFAAKGGNQSKGYLYSGSDDIDEVAVTRENSRSGSPIAVKSKQPNELGIYDMSGNAYEWVDDYGGDYSAEDQVDPQNTSGSRSYVKRGGSNYHDFTSEPYLFTTTGRYFYRSTDWTIGFRIALR
ncbi:formylglycine-generating enzyme family protein [Eisenbergiella sp.]